MKRLTRPFNADNYRCKIAGGCLAEDWIEEVSGVNYYNWQSEFKVCDNCPFEKYINALSRLEDEAELMENDGK